MKIKPIILLLLLLVVYVYQEHYKSKIWYKSLKGINKIKTLHYKSGNLFSKINTIPSFDVSPLKSGMCVPACQVASLVSDCL